MPAGNHAKQRLTYSLLTAVFWATFGLFFQLKRTDRKPFRLRPFDLVQLGFATYRLGRMVSYDKVMEPYRAPVTKTVPDPTGAGLTVVPKGEGVQHALGDLISCPICAGTWVAAGMVYALELAPRPARTFLAIMSAVGMAEFLDAATEALQWTGQARRVETGAAHKESGE